MGSGAVEIFSVELVDLFCSGRSNQPISVVTLSPPIRAPVAGARVNLALIGSPASQRGLDLVLAGQKEMYVKLRADV